ncbi:MAG TPA: ABC transporter substrate-binding protein [Ilumatobacteraceae bacterium]|nr:ABC transporter substrate-binding protein [Ilumatobacteraceae bacterium]
MRQRRLVSALAVPLVFAFVAASCGSDDSSSDDTTPTDGTEAAPEATDDSGETGDTAPPDTGGDVDTTVAENTDAPVMGGSLIMGLEAEATGLRPWEDACGEPCVNIARTDFDVLVSQNTDGEYEGNLAESIEPNEDFTEWTMVLRPDVTFHNEVPLTAQTIADMFAIQQTGTQSSGLIATYGIAGVEAVDDLTVLYTLSAPNSAFPAAVNTVPIGYVFEPAAAAADPVGFSTNPIGTGPFTMVSRDIDNETVVERNENYWRTDADGNQLPYLDQVAFRPIPDEGTRLDALISGTVNLMETRRQGTIRDARAESGISLFEFQGNNTGGGMFNTAVPPFDDVRVRLGLNKLNDQERVIEALGGTGISQPVTQWFSADSPWWTQEAADTYPTFNFEEGTALLQEYIDDPARTDGKAAGEPIDVELSCPPDPTLIAAMQVLEQVWSGSELVNVSLTQFDQATHINNAVADTHRAHCWRWGTEADPSAAINPFLTDPAESVSNFPNWFDPEAYGWAVEAIQTADVEERKALYSKIMVRINEQAPVWYSGGTATLVATDVNIRGVNDWTLPSGNTGNGTPGALIFFPEMFVTG